MIRFFCLLLFVGVAALGLPGCVEGSGSADREKKKTGGDDPLPGGPTNLLYAQDSVSVRVGEAVTLSAPTNEGGTPIVYTIAPALPSGLAIDFDTGEITGTPDASLETTAFTVAASNADGRAETTIDLQITPSLPADLLELEPGFVAERFLTATNVAAKMAFAPDGRLFYSELSSGQIRVVRPDGTLLATPFASIAVEPGGERGLLGLAFAPDFETSGHLFVFAGVPASGGKPVRNQVIRLTAVGDLGTAPIVIVDDLPAGDVHNAGAIAFVPDGKLYVSVGDVGDSSRSQTDDDRAGRVLRYEPDGTIPTDNPIADDPEWSRGLRNPFGMTFHPTTGGLFVSENGPTFQDEINFIQRDKNFEWQTLPDDFPGSRIGIRIIDWTPVIAPTGLTFLARGGFGPDYADNLFLGAYAEEEIRRLELSGSAFIDLDAEHVFAKWRAAAGAHKPLDVVEGTDGALYVSTFTDIWRISRFP